MLTKQKVHFMFKIQKKVLEREMRVERDSKLKNFCREMVDSSLQWKSDLTSQLYEESQENQKVEKDRRQREAIAKEKRKWTLAHSKVSGKSLKKRGSHFSNKGNVESREQILMKSLRMQTYFTQLSQLENAVKPLNKLCVAW